MTMNTLGLGAAVRPAARVSAKKASFTGAPVVGKSSFAVRKTVAPKAGRVVAMAAGAEPIMEAPFKGIKDDLAARGPLYIDDFKQGISTKSLVRVPIFPIIRLPPFSKRTNAIGRSPSCARSRARARKTLRATLRIRSKASRYVVPFFERRARARLARRRRAHDEPRSVFFKRLATWTLLGYTPWFFLNKTLVERFAPASWQSRLSAKAPKPTRAATRRPTRRLTVPFFHLRSFRRVVGVRLLPVLRRARPRDRVRRGAHVGDGGHARRD